MIPGVKVPVLIVQGQKDDTVKAKSAKFIYNTIGSRSKQLHFLPQSRHLVCCSPEKERVFQLVREFATLAQTESIVSEGR